MKRSLILLVLCFISAAVFSQSYLARAQKNNLTGYIDETGKEVISPQYDEASDFNSGLAAVRKVDQWMYINTKGKQVGEGGYEFASGFSEGMAAVKKGGKFGYINSSGKLVIQPKFKFANGFSEGLAAVKTEGSDFWGYIDNSGKTVIEPKFNFAADFKNGLAIIFMVEKNDKGKWITKHGVINTKGEYLVEPEYLKINDFVDGVAITEMRSPGGKGTLKGAINAKGEVIAPARYYELGQFVDGLAPARLKPDDKIGYMNLDGEIVIKGNWDLAKPFQNGLAIVGIGDGKPGLYPKVKEGSKIVENADDFTKLGVINKDGKLVIPMEYRSLEPAGENAFVAEKVDRIGAGVVNTDGKVLIPFEHDRLVYLGDDLLANNWPSSGKTTILDIQGKKVSGELDMDIPQAYYFNGLIRVRTNTLLNCGMIDRTGTFKVKPDYYVIWDFAKVE